MGGLRQKVEDSRPGRGRHLSAFRGPSVRRRGFAPYICGAPFWGCLSVCSFNPSNSMQVTANGARFLSLSNIKIQLKNFAHHGIHAGGASGCRGAEICSQRLLQAGQGATDLQILGHTDTKRVPNLNSF